MMVLNEVGERRLWYDADAVAVKCKSCAEIAGASSAVSNARKVNDGQMKRRALALKI